MAWKWMTTRRAGFSLLVPPIVMPAFDVIRVEGEALSLVRTVPMEVVPAHNVAVDTYRSIRSPTFLYHIDSAEASERKAKDVMTTFEVRVIEATLSLGSCLVLAAYSVCGGVG